MHCALRSLVCAGSQGSCPQEPMQCVQAVKGLFCTLDFWKETCLDAPRAKAPLGEGDPSCIMSSRGLWPCQERWHPASCWRSDHRVLPFSFSCAACASKCTVFYRQPPSPAISTLLLLSLSPLLPFPPLLLNLYFFFSVPAKRYQSR